MPLLKREPDFHPSNLFQLQADEYCWSVLHVRSRQEKVAARHLHRNDIGFYLPQYQRTTRRGGRNLVSFLPLFPGYVFVRTTKVNHGEVWSSRVVARIIDVSDQGTLSSQLQQLVAFQEAGALLMPYPDLAPGDPVEITDGAFKGYQGIILREKGRLRLVVSVTMLRQAVVVEFSREMLAPLHGSAAVA